MDEGLKRDDGLNGGSSSSTTNNFPFSRSGRRRRRSRRSSRRRPFRFGRRRPRIGQGLEDSSAAKQQMWAGDPAIQMFPKSSAYSKGGSTSLSYSNLKEFQNNPRAFL